MKNKTIILLVGLALSACQHESDDTEPENKTTKPIDALPGVPAEKVENNLKLTLSSNYQTFQYGETAVFTARLENVGSTDLILFQSSPCSPVINMGVTSSDETLKKSLDYGGLPVACGAVVVDVPLEVGEVLSREVSWDLSFYENIFAENGDYKVTAKALLDTGNSNETKGVSIAINVAIQSGLEYKSLLEVLNIAFNDASVKDWYAINDYENKCILTESSNYKVIEFTNGQARYSDESVTPQSDNTTLDIPGCNANLIEGPLWQVTIRNKFGVASGSYGFKIDASTGVITARE